MKTTLGIWVALILAFSPVVGRAEPKPPAGPAQSPGAEFAQQISVLTGVAITPLLGTSAYGAFTYFKAAPEKRAGLAWFAQPWFFVPALVLVGICFLKDTAGTALPTALKKPLDIAEAVEHKISGLVATGAFVPLLMMMTMKGNNESSAVLSSMGVGAVDGSSIFHLLMVPVSMVAFFVVFLASNAINILIILSPFTTVDAALKGARLALLGTITATAWANPWIGAAWALIVILISYLIAGWSFRLSHFGAVYVWDFFTFRRTRFTPDAATNKMFLGQKLSKVPARTYGQVSRDAQGQLVLKYRPWLVLPQRTLILPPGQYAVGKGLFNSEIIKVEGAETQTAFLLPPRYRSHEEAVAKVYGLSEVRPIGLRAAMKWLRELFSGKPQPATA